MTKNINGRELVFVEVPEVAVKFKISGTGYLCYKMGYTNEWDNTSNVWNTGFDYKLPEGKYSIIGLASSLLEEQWTGIVKELPIGRRFENYCGDYPIWYHKVKQSGLSLLSSLGMNPQTTLILIKEK